MTKKKIIEHNPDREERSHFKFKSRVVPSPLVLSRHPRRSTWIGSIIEFELYKGDTTVWVLWDKTKAARRHKFNELALAGYVEPACFSRVQKRYLIHPKHRPPVAPIRTCPHGVPQPGKCHDCDQTNGAR